MLRRSLFVLLALGSAFLSVDAHAAPGRVDVAQVNCNGTAVIRTEVGQLEIVSIPANIEGCVGSTPSQTSVVPPAGSSQAPTQAQSGTVKVPTGNTTVKKETPKKRFNPENGPLLDLASTDVGNYRIDRMKEQGIKYANPVRSVRMRQAPTKNSNTNAYLIKNDAVVVSQTGSGWTKAQ